MNALTDDTGMLQHAIFTIPNRAEGHTTDDNARALIFTVMLEQFRAGAGEDRICCEFPMFSAAVSVVSRTCIQSSEWQVQKFSRLRSPVERSRRL